MSENTLAESIRIRDILDIFNANNSISVVIANYTTPSKTYTLRAYRAGKSIKIIKFPTFLLNFLS